MRISFYLTRVNLILIMGFTMSNTCCNSQSPSDSQISTIGGPCEGCEALFEYGNKELQPTDTLPEFDNNSMQISISGTVFNVDRLSPAKDVVIYIYHTDRAGIYARRGDETGWGTRHGYYRGWVKTDIEGKYSFYTFRPAAYPNGREPEHIHMTILEPNKNPYYIDAIMFVDDPKLTKTQIASLKKRGGNGIVNLEQRNGIFRAQRDIVLGLNIPDHY